MNERVNQISWSNDVSDANRRKQHFAKSTDVNDALLGVESLQRTPTQRKKLFVQSRFVSSGVMTNVQVRLAVESDAPLLARLRYEFRSSFDQVIESEERFIERCSAWMQERLNTAGPWKCWIAAYDHRLEIVVGGSAMGNDERHSTDHSLAD
jgi:hypothetical protein